jgi:uncharacterized protein (DUF1330 family)
MPNGYWIARIEVTDGDRYSKYAEALPAVITRFGGHFLVAGGRCETAEGKSKPRNVIISFEDYETARNCWHSKECAAVARLREGAAIVDVVIVEGVNGCTPT